MAQQPRPTSSNRANKAAIHAVIGATGSGKTTHVMNCIRRARPGRVLIWDSKGEFSREGFASPVKSMADMGRLLLAAGSRGKFALAYQPHGDQEKLKKDFSRFCLLAFHAKNCWLIAEELAEVTGPSWAPEGWRKATTQGRSEGLTIYGLSQAPAWIDKYFFGNCSSIRSGRVVFDAHVKTMAGVLGVPGDDIRKLHDGEFIELQISPRKVTRGKIF